MNKKILLILIIAILSISTIGYLSTLDDKSEDFKKEFVPDVKIIKEETTEKGTVYTIKDKEDKVVEVNRDSYLIEGEHNIYQDNYDNGDGTGKFISYAYERNVYEDGGWKRIENARSLKDYKGFGTRENDNRYGYKVNEWNQSSINVTGLIYSDEDIVPFKVNGIIVGNLRNNEQIVVNNINVLSSNFTIGEHSTTFSINESGGDFAFAGSGSYLNVRNATNFTEFNTGCSVGIRNLGGVNDYYICRTVLNFSMSLLPPNRAINYANLSIYLRYVDGVGSSSSFPFNITAKNFSMVGTDLSINGNFKNFEGWQDGVTHYSGRNLTYSTSVKTFTLDTRFNLTLTPDGLNQINFSQGRDFQMMLMDDNDINATVLALGTQQYIGFGDSVFFSPPFLEVSYGDSVQSNSTTNIGIISLRLNSTLGNNYTNEDLYVSGTPIVNNTATSLFANISWFRNGVNNVTYNNILFTNNTYFQSRLNHENTTKGEVWYSVINISNIEGTRNYTSNNLTILNSPPSVPTLNFPIDNVYTTNYTVNLSILNSSDIDGDSINYDFYIGTANPPTTSIGNATNRSVTYSFPSSTLHYWRVMANDGFSGSSYTSVRTIEVDWRLLLVNQSFYNNPVLIGSFQSYLFNLSFNPDVVSSTDVIITYNNTQYSTSKTNITVNFTSFLASFNVPNIIEGSSVDKLFSWNVTIHLLNGTNVYNNSFIQSQTIRSVNFSYCQGTEGNMVVVLNYTFRDEENDTIIVGNTTQSLSAEANYLLYQNDASANQSFLLGTITNKSNFKICMSPPDVSTKIDGQIKYVGVGYNSRDYYYRNYSVDNITDNTGLYLFDSGKATGIKFIVTDPDDIEIEDAIITVKRYSVGNDSLRTIAMGKTNFDGEDLIYLRKNDVFYSIYITQKDGTITIFPNQKIINVNDEINIKITSGTLAEIISAFNNAVKDITISGKTFKAYYNDSTGKVQEGCFSIQRISAINGSTVYYNCISSSSGSWVYTVDNQSAVFEGVITLKINSKISTISKIVDFTTKVLFSVLGSKTALFIAIMISISLLGFGLVSPAFAVIVSLFTTIFFFMLGLTPMGIAALVSFIVIGVLLLKKLNE